MPGIRPYSSYLFQFQREKYQRDLSKGLQNALQEATTMLYRKVWANASGLPLKDNWVRLANGRITSDADRRMALLSSIVYRSPFREEMYRLHSRVSAMGSNFTESHIGYYYEYGTGEKADPSHLPMVGVGNSRNWNIFRSGGVPTVGAPIVSRSKNVHGGQWTDLGGNRRVTGSLRGGEDDEGFREYIGEDTPALHWFGQAVKEVKEDLYRNYRKVLREVSFSHYFTTAKSFTLGRWQNGR